MFIWVLLLCLATRSSAWPSKGIKIVCTGEDPSEPCYAEGSDPVRPQDLVQGDIIKWSYEKYLVMESFGFMNAIIDPRHHWPNATVPYVFHKSFTKENKATILKSLKFLEEKTCVRFVPWNQKGGYALVTNEHGCHSTIGYTLNKKGYGHVNVHNTSCLKRPGTVQHEFLHLLGLKHEQARPDRDQYVDVVWDNIKEEHKKNFEKADPKLYTTFGLPYDYKSVMHYGNFEFSKNGKATLEAKIDRSMKLGQRKQATETDLEKIRRMYCGGKKAIKVVRVK